MALGDPGVSPPPQTDVAAQVPEGVPVKLEVDIANNTSSYVALTPAELAQRDVDQAAVEVAAKADAKVAADRDVLVAKLAAGKATTAEVQDALARVLGGGS